jgi:acetyltransferase
MIDDLKGAALLRGYRNRPAADEDALVDLVVKVSRMAHVLRNEISALDLNPVMVLPAGGGVRIVDVVMNAG